jgi:hypothetical protein
MGFIAGLIGTGGPIIVAAVTWIMLGHYHRLPSGAHPWICRALIAVMFCAGVALAISPLGTWLTSVVTSVSGWFGGIGSGLGHVLIVVSAWSLLATAIVAMVWQPNDQVATMALFLPWILSLVPSGVLAHLYASVTVPAQAAAQALSSWLGG